MCPDVFGGGQRFLGGTEGKTLETYLTQYFKFISQGLYVTLLMVCHIGVMEVVPLAVCHLRFVMS